MIEELKKYKDLIDELELLDHKTFFTWYENLLKGGEEISQEIEDYASFRIKQYFYSNLFDRR